MKHQGRLDLRYSQLMERSFVGCRAFRLRTRILPRPTGESQLKARPALGQGFTGAVAMALVACLALGGCSRFGKPTTEELERTSKAFHQHLRWKNFRTAAQYLVPERQAKFLLERERLKDEKDLTVTDFRLDDAAMTADGRATAHSRISWFRLPSVSEQSDAVATNFIWHEKTWWVVSQEGGPFTDLQGPPPKSVWSTDAGSVAPRAAPKVTAK